MTTPVPNTNVQPQPLPPPQPPPSGTPGPGNAAPAQEAQPRVYCSQFASTEGVYRLKMDLCYQYIVLQQNTALPILTPSMAPAKYVSLVSVRFRGLNPSTSASGRTVPVSASAAANPTTTSASNAGTTTSPADSPTLASSRTASSEVNTTAAAAASPPAPESERPGRGANESSPHLGPQGSIALAPPVPQTMALRTSPSSYSHAVAPFISQSAETFGTPISLADSQGTTGSSTLVGGSSSVAGSQASPLPNSLPPLSTLTVPTAKKGPGSGGLTPGDEESNFSLFQSVKLKKRSKSSNLNKKDGGFVAQVVWNDKLAGILAQRQHEDTYFFFNTGRSFFWADLGCRPQEPLGRLDLQKAVPTCHDVNMLTRSGSSLDVIIGCNTGDLLWFDPITQKRNRFNAQGVINGSAVTLVRWVPGSETLFMASFADGAVVLFDKNKEDHGNFNPQFAMDPTHPLQVAKPSKVKYNPTTYWQLGRRAVAAFAFSPDCRHAAFVSSDGRLRIVDFTTEILEDTYTAYFGGLTCVCWSPDGKYILTGGQDDLITIWDFYGQRILARCQGHQSWVNGVAFDPWRCDETNYRFGSVGEDTRLLLWDFSVNALHRPKSTAVQLRRTSRASSTYNPHAPRQSLPPPKHVNVFHDVSLRNEVAVLEPIMSQSVHQYAVCSVLFREDSLMTTCRAGHIKVWTRPDPPST